MSNYSWLDTYDDRYHRIDYCPKCGASEDRGIDFTPKDYKYPQPSNSFCVPFESDSEDDHF